MRAAGRLETLGIIGAGSVGQALARLLAHKFELLIASRSRAAEAAEFAGAEAKAVALGDLADGSDCIVVAVPDRAVPTIARRLAMHAPRVVLQTCGALGPSDLSPLPEQGVSCATFHPLQTFPDPRAGVDTLPGSVFGACGQGVAAEWCVRLAGELGGRTLRVSEDRLPLYHAAAVVASNYAVGMVHAASKLMELAGIGNSEARQAMRPLIEASVRNALTMETEKALTGPIARGDATTVQRHLDAMRGHSGPLAELYRASGRYLLPVAVRRGLTPESTAALRLSLSKEP